MALSLGFQSENFETTQSFMNGGFLLGLLFYFIFITSMSFVMLNIFISIICAHLEDAKVLVDCYDDDSYTLWSFIKDEAKYYMDKCKCCRKQHDGESISKSLMVEVLDNVDAGTHTEKYVHFAESKPKVEENKYQINFVNALRNPKKDVKVQTLVHEAHCSTCLRKIKDNKSKRLRKVKARTKLHNDDCPYFQKQSTNDYIFNKSTNILQEVVIPDGKYSENRIFYNRIRTTKCASARRVRFNEDCLVHTYQESHLRLRGGSSCHKNRKSRTLRTKNFAKDIEVKMKCEFIIKDLDKIILLI